MQKDDNINQENTHEELSVEHSRPQNNLPYEILPNGKTRYLRATAVDIIICVLIPIIGVILAVVAMARKENKRAVTMVIISAAAWGVYLLINSNLR
ncbi:MAG: hypothetical protein ACRCWR_07190 [Saezia sp.]